MTGISLVVTYVAKHTYAYQFTFTDETTGNKVDPSAITFEAWREVNGRFQLQDTKVIGDATHDGLGIYTFKYDHPKGGTYRMAINAPSSGQYFAFEVEVIITPSVREQ